MKVTGLKKHALLIFVKVFVLLSVAGYSNLH